MEKPNTTLAESLNLPWKEYANLSHKECQPLNWIKRICLDAVAENKAEGRKGYIVITDGFIESLKTPKGGFTRNTIEKLGLTWPLKRGWKNKIIGTEVELKFFR